MRARGHPSPHYEHVDGSGRLWEWDEQVEGGDSWMAGYVYIHGTKDDCPVARTEDVGKGVHIDYAADGRVLGIEFI